MYDPRFQGRIYVYLDMLICILCLASSEGSFYMLPYQIKVWLCLLNAPCSVRPRPDQGSFFVIIIYLGRGLVREGQRGLGMAPRSLGTRWRNGNRPTDEGDVREELGRVVSCRARGRKDQRSVCHSVCCFSLSLAPQIVKTQEMTN